MVKKWVIYRVVDPSILGQPGKEIKEVFQTFDKKEDAVNKYNELKAIRRFAGVDCVYYTYPVEKEI